MPALTRSETMASSGGAEGARALDVGPDTGVTFTDLGQLVLGIVHLVEHREMPFCIGCLVWDGCRCASRHAIAGVGGAASSAVERAA